MVTILIVDDSNSLRQAFSSILTPLKMKVLLANNGNHAIQMLGQHTPDLVITDLIMPEMNGYELCRWIKNNPSTQTIPVLMCSTKSEEFDRYWGMKQGADAYMTKPFQAADLITMVQQLLEISQSNR